MYACSCREHGAGCRECDGEVPVRRRLVVPVLSEQHKSCIHRNSNLDSTEQLRSVACCMVYVHTSSLSTHICKHVSVKSSKKIIYSLAREHILLRGPPSYQIHPRRCDGSSRTPCCPFPLGGCTRRVVAKGVCVHPPTRIVESHFFNLKCRLIKQPTVLQPLFVACTPVQR